MMLTVDLMKELESWRNYGLKTQLERSSISIPSNIAEGYERKSNKEFIQFLCIARGSCARQVVSGLQNPVSHYYFDELREI